MSEGQQFAEEEITGLEPTQTAQAIATEDLQKQLDELKLIAQRIGKDFKMQVKLGTPNGGSFFDPEKVEIIIDPTHIEKDPELAQFVVAHEGSHRAITVGPTEMGLGVQKSNELYGQPGFRYMNNVIEDCAIGDWGKGMFPKLKPLIERNYDKDLAKENAVLWAAPEGTPEWLLVMKFYAEHGYMPRFTQWGSEVIRDWHQGRFSKQLDPEVEKALKKTIKPAQKSVEEIPSIEDSDSRKKVVKSAQKRFKINKDEIWPEVKKLVEMDLHIEAMRQWANELLNKLRELKQLQQEEQEASKQNDEKKFEELTKRIDDLKKEIQELGGDKMDQKALEQLEKEMEKAANKNTEMRKKAEAIAEKKQEKNSLESKKKALEQEIKELEKQLESLQKESGGETSEKEPQKEDGQGEESEEESPENSSGEKGAQEQSGEKGEPKKNEDEVKQELENKKNELEDLENKIDEVEKEIEELENPPKPPKQEKKQEMRVKFEWQEGMEVRDKKTGKKGTVIEVLPNGKIKVDFSSDRPEPVRRMFAE